MIDALVYLLIVHWVGDFIFQSRKMGEKKSTSLYWLGYHCLTYGVVFFIGSAIIGIQDPLIFAAINTGLHFVTDFITSKISGWFWINSAKGNNKQMVKFFWTTIGMDQMIHGICIVKTLEYVSSIS